jgi:hypothetical protein
MTKPKSKPKAANRSIARKAVKPAPRKRSATAPSRPAARSNTKHARIIAMLRKPAGATIAAIVTLVSEQTDKGRIYRIKDSKASPATSQQAA